MPDRSIPPQVIIHLGNNTQQQTVERVLELYDLYGRVTPIICSGARGHLTESNVATEAGEAAKIAAQLGIPRKHILMEVYATNTGENIKFSRDLCERLALNVSTLIAVQKPFMERRIASSFELQWPEVTALVTSPQVSLTAYATDTFPLLKMIEVMISDLVKLKEYGGVYNTVQEIPTPVWTAAQWLCSHGYDGDLSPKQRELLMA